MGEELTTRIKEESRILDRAKAISKSMRDRKFKLILECVVEDERTHHKMLTKLSEITNEKARNSTRYFRELANLRFP